LRLILPGGREVKFLERADPAISLDQYLSFFTYAGLQYPLTPGQTLQSNKEQIPNSFVGYTQGAYKSNGIVWSCMLARLMLFSEARFQWRRLGSGGNGRPQDLWGDPRLVPLEKPWPNATTGDLLTRAIQDVDLAGNFYALRGSNQPDRPPPGQIIRIRPDWMTIVLGSFKDPDVINGDLDAQLLGYLYHPGGPASGREPIYLAVDEVAHFAPIPDPIANFRGMSWLTPLLAEVQADSSATRHKLSFFDNGATLGYVVTLDPTMLQEAFERWIKVFRTQHEGAMNAYRTLYLGGGADIKTVGANFQQMEFKVTQGAGETRIAAAAGVPPIIAGFSEGLQSAPYANYRPACRRFADLTIRPLWRNFCGSMETIVPPPGGSQLWYDDRDIAFLHEDRKDQADVHQVEATSISSLISAGFEPDSAVAAVTSGDLTLLKHSGLYSVQLQPPLNPAVALPPLGGDAPALPAPEPDPAANGAAPKGVKP